MANKTRPPIEVIVQRFETAQQNSITALAKEIGVSRPTLYKMVEDYYEANPERRKTAPQGRAGDKNVA